MTFSVFASEIVRTIKMATVSGAMDISPSDWHNQTAGALELTRNKL